MPTPLAAYVAANETYPPIPSVRIAFVTFNCSEEYSLVSSLHGLTATLELATTVRPTFQMFLSTA